VNYLVDTNVLLRSTQKLHPFHKDAVRATLKLKQRGEGLCVLSQNSIEFWAVATRPLVANGLDMTIDEAKNEMAKLKKFFVLLPDSPKIFDEWETPVVQHQVAGKPTHDARLVAAMKVYNVTHLLTFNASDFKRFTSITAIDLSGV
jgi:predicted nucleic acid-binding protein